MRCTGQILSLAGDVIASLQLALHDRSAACASVRLALPHPPLSRGCLSAAMGDNGGAAPGMGRKLFNAGASVTRFAGRLVLSTVCACVAAPPCPRSWPLQAAAWH